MADHVGVFAPVTNTDEVAFAMTLFVCAASRHNRRHTILNIVKFSRECKQLFHFLTAIMPRGRCQDGGKHDGTLEDAFGVLWTHYDGDPRQKSICARVLGFHRLMMITEGELIAGWTLSPEDQPEIVLLHPAVVQSVATTPLWESGEMMRPAFLRTLESVNKAGKEQGA